MLKMLVVPEDFNSLSSKYRLVTLCSIKDVNIIKKNLLSFQKEFGLSPLAKFEDRLMLFQHSSYPIYGYCLYFIYDKQVKPSYSLASICYLSITFGGFWASGSVEFAVY